MNLISKYEPKDIKNLIGHKDQIKKIQEIYKKNPFKTIVIIGPNGCGKSATIKLVLQDLNFKIKFYDTVTYNNENLIQEMVNLNHNNIKYILKNETSFQKTALIIDNLDHISLSNERNVIDKIIEYNLTKKKFPLVLIINNLNSKSLDTYSDDLIRLHFNFVSKSELTKYLEYILKNEEIKVTDKYISNTIIDFCQKDIRRLLFILQDIINSGQIKEINKHIIDEYISKSQKKNIDMNLFESLKEILIAHTNISKTLSIYNTDKVLLPLTLHENYLKEIFTNSNCLNEKMIIAKKVSSLISKGDVIESDIYNDQNWDLQQTHFFFSICMPIFVMNKQKKYTTGDDIKYNISFSSELNKTSLKNINRKNIFNLNIFFNSSVCDILDKSFILNELLQQSRYDDINNLINDYTEDKIKLLEILIKIDKCNKEPVVLTTKIKKSLA